MDIGDQYLACESCSVQSSEILGHRLVNLSHCLSSYAFLSYAMSIQHAIIPINKTCKQSQALHKAFKVCIQQETLTDVTQTWRQKEETIHRIQHLWQ